MAVRAERLGFDSAWISDHFFFSLERYGGPAGLHGSLEPMTALAGLAAVTERIRLGTLVACAQFRHPAIMTKMATAIDLVSGGRLDLGMGAGWYADEFDAFGYPFGGVGERFGILEETLQVMGLLLGEGPVDFEGRHFRLHGAYNRPRPAQKPRPPLWLGAKGGPRALRLAARHADGWNTVWKWEPEAYSEKVALARRICEEEGRDPATLRLSVGLHALIGENERDLGARYREMQRWMPGGALDGVPVEVYARDALVGTPDRVLERIARFGESGVEEIIVSPAPLPFAIFDMSMLETLAEVVLARTRSG